MGVPVIRGLSRFLNAAEYIERKYGRDKLASVLRECGPAVRERYTTVIAIDWQEMVELCDFIETAERVLGSDAGKLAEEIGEAGARINTRGMLLRAAFHVGKPQYLMRRLASMWRQFNDEGTMLVLEMSDQHVKLEVTGLREPRSSFCNVLTGWCSEMTRALGVIDARVAHLQCRARGAKRCIREIHGRVSGP